MKNMLFSALCLLLPGAFFAQKKITVQFSQTELMQLTGKNQYEQVLESGYKSEAMPAEGTKIINLHKMETEYYENGELKKIFKIDNIQKEGKMFIIKYTEEDLRNGKPLETIQVIDTKRKKSYYSWYYDGDDNSTFVVQEKKVSMKLDD
jgi:hypothetical protein